jgi:hypothetical protein
MLSGSEEAGTGLPAEAVFDKKLKCAKMQKWLNRPEPYIIGQDKFGFKKSVCVSCFPPDCW